MKALWHINEKESSLIHVNEPLFTDTIIESIYSFISTGTERLVANGFVPGELYTTMAVPYMEGSFSFPVKYGYSLVGRIVKSNVLKEGSLVHVMHPHQDQCYISFKDANKIPTAVSAKRAVLVSNMETVINAIWDGQLKHKSTVLIAGYGIIGAMLARVCKNIYDCDVFVLEKESVKKEFISAHGYYSPESKSILYDVAFNCSANEQALQYCINHVKEEAAVIELSWYGSKKINICLGGSFHSMRKKIIASQVSVIPPHMQLEWDYIKRRALAFDILHDDFFDKLLTNEIKFEDSPAFFMENRGSDLTGIGYFISY